MAGSWYPPVHEVALIEPLHAEDSSACLTGVVSSVQAGHVRIDLDPPAALPDREDDVVVSFFRPDALYRLMGIAVLHLGPPVAIDLEVGRSERVQRREVPRARCELPVELSDLDGTDGFSTVLGHTIDIGPGGCRVVTERPYRTGSDPTVTVAFPDGAKVVNLARILERKEAGGHHEYRLVFVDLDPNDARRIAGLVERGLPRKLNA